MRHYLDLFAGPGRCHFDDDSDEIDGSPLVALAISPPFTKYHFVDMEPVALDALTRRVHLRAPGADVAFYPTDANETVAGLRAAVPYTALSVAVVDQTGLHLRFEALRRLVEGRRMDLIYLFPEPMAAKRNLEKFLERSWGPLDEVLGTDEWRHRAPTRVPEGADPEQHWEQVGRPIVEIFKRQLVTLGYQDVELGSDVLVRSRKNVPLYYLVFASKAALGHKFWDAVRRIDPAGQMGLF